MAYSRGREITTIIVALTLSVGGAWGCRTQTVRPDKMSVAQHREEARQATQAADEHARAFDPSAPVATPPPEAPQNGYNFTVGVYNPTEWHLQASERLREHARQHTQAAKLLERFEATECKQFPPTTRAACPLLGPVTKIEDIPGGVRVTFAAGTRLDAVIAHMRCHYAYAQVRGFSEAAGCPLYIRGVEIRRGSDPLAVEIVAKDTAVGDQIRARSREEAVFLHEPSS